MLKAYKEMASILVIGLDRKILGNHRSEPYRSRVFQIGSRSDPDPGNLVREPDRGSRIAFLSNTAKSSIDHAGISTNHAKISTDHTEICIPTIVLVSV